MQRATGDCPDESSTSPQRGSGLVRRLFLSLATVGICVGLGEMILRVFERENADTTFDRPSVYYGAIGYSRLHPWARGTPDPLRIVVIGDSFTMGTAVQPADSYGMRLEQLLNVNDGVRPAEVRIFAQAGANTSREVRYLASALKWKPKIVILGVVLNDTEDWHDRQVFGEMRRRAQPWTPSPSIQPMLDHSRMASWLFGRLNAVHVRRSTLEYYKRLFQTDYPGWRHFCRALDLFKQTCDRESIELVTLVFPMLDPGISTGQYPYQAIHEQIAGALEERGILSLDLLPHFAGKSILRLQAHPFIDGHPSEIGHRIAAERLIDFLLEKKVLPEEYRPKMPWPNDIEYWKQMMSYEPDARAP